MKKLVICFALLFSFISVSEASIHLNKGETLLEIGTSLNSNINVEGPLTLDIKGESGYKLSVFHALDDKLALQYKLSDFSTEEKTFYGLTDSGNAKVQDINLLYRVTPHINLIAGYENSRIDYDHYVSSATKSAVHIGLSAYTPISEKADVFATYIHGKDVSLKEVGITYDIDKHSLVTLSYVDRRLNNLDLRADLLHMNTTANYKMHGLALMYGIKL